VKLHLIAACGFLIGWTAYVQPPVKYWPHEKIKFIMRNRGDAYRSLHSGLSPLRPAAAPPRRNGEVIPPSTHGLPPGFARDESRAPATAQKRRARLRPASRKPAIVAFCRLLSLNFARSSRRA